MAPQLSLEPVKCAALPAPIAAAAAAAAAAALFGRKHSLAVQQYKHHQSGLTHAPG